MDAIRGNVLAQENNVGSESSVDRTSLGEALYCVLILSCALPTGTVFGFPLKLVLIGLSALTILPFAFERVVLRDRLLWCAGAVVLALVAWTGFAWANGYRSSSLNCLRLFLALVSVIVLGRIGLITGAFRISRIANAIRLAAALVVGLDFFYEILMLTGFGLLFYPDLYNTGSVSELVRGVFGKGIVTCMIPLGGFHLFRITLPNDVLALAVLPFELCRPQTWRRRCVILAIGAVFALITYSRVVMLQYALVITLVGCWCLRRLDRKKVLKALLAAVAVLLVLAPLVIRFAAPMVRDRLLSADARKSDRTRVEQYQVLSQGISESPLFGHGLGSFVRCPGRGGDECYSYELQYLSFVYQFGMVGFALIIGGMLFLSFRLCLAGAPGGMVRVIVWFNLIVWALKPLFNPQFLSSNSAAVVVATLFLALSEDSR